MPAPESIVEDDSVVEESNLTQAEPVSIVQVDLDKNVDLEVEYEEDEEKLSAAELIARKHAKEQHGYEKVVVAEEEEEAPAGPEMVDIKVNGVVSSVEKSKVDANGGVAAYQKLLAGEEKLRAAADDRKLLDEEITAIRAREDAVTAKELALSAQADESLRKTDLPDEGDHSIELGEKARAVREALFEGEEGAIDAALVDLIQSAREGSATQADVLEAVGEKAASRVLKTLESDNFERDRLAAVAVFETDYEDIAGDPELKSMADEKTNRISQENPSWTPSQVITAAASETREWVNKLKGGNQEQPTEEDENLLEAKLEFKRSMSNVKTPTGRTPPKQEPKQETNSEYIARLRKGRGLAAT
tara:strand:- start:256 stop:1338 length:1083 start_codon:yes stop_codon:yes gene_type:complete